MQFFVYEIVARIVAIYLCVHSSRKLWYGLVEKKIAHFNPDLLDWWSYRDVHRDAAPIRYWIQIGIRITILAAFLSRYLAGGNQTPEHPLMPFCDIRIPLLWVDKIHQARRTLARRFMSTRPKADDRPCATFPGTRPSGRNPRPSRTAPAELPGTGSAAPAV